MLNQISVEEVKEISTVDRETKELTIALVNERIKELGVKRAALDEIKRIRTEIRAEQGRIKRAKEEVRRIDGIVSEINERLSDLTNAKIAEKMGISTRRVNYIMQNRSSK